MVIILTLLVRDCLDPVSTIADLANDEFVLGSPQVKKAIIHLQNGKQFIIATQNFSINNIYVDEVKLNKHKQNKPSINYKNIMSGGQLKMKMKNK